jgi:hypothetical protein
MMSDEIDSAVRSLVNNLIPIVKRRILRSFDRSREDVEFEIAYPGQSAYHPRKNELLLMMAKLSPL